jgi:uncharacterized protein YyaL (SSP411 family)
MTNQNNGSPAHTNRLIGENSPYLLSHAHNPVDWYPWGEEAIARARELDRPIFLSVGYAACHWCHVMEHESFENEAIAEILNREFVCIKVDREQRPDLDHIYMNFTQALTGAGGWPMSVFLAPNLKPFFAGTYFPPENTQGRPGFKYIIEEIAKAYRETKEQIIESSEGIFNEILNHLNRRGDTTRINDAMMTQGVESLLKNFDHGYGGFGSAPKFPHATELALFLRHARKSGDISYLLAAEKALYGMARGGIYDHVGGGFARYSTDARWLVPHFEKMLYDNALLVTTYSDAWLITQSELYLKTIRGTLDFILREMTDESGGFYSALDADSEGVEGKFYVWTRDEIVNALGSDAELFCSYFNVTEAGNFEGNNILNIDIASDRVREKQNAAEFDATMSKCLSRLLKFRSGRVRPLTDDKVLTSWNGLTLTAMCRGYRITRDQRYLDAARANAEFVKRYMYRDGALGHTWRKGNLSGGEFLEDYAFYIRGLLDLFETDGSEENGLWLQFARDLTDRALEVFMDRDNSFYLRPDHQTDLIIRPREETDNAIPAASSSMLHNLVRLYRLTNNKPYVEKAELGLKSISGQLARFPGSMASALLALDYFLGEKTEVVITGDGAEREEMIRLVHQKYMPHGVIAISHNADQTVSPLFEGRQAQKGQAQAFVCRNSVCGLPAHTVSELSEQLHGL